MESSRVEHCGTSFSESLLDAQKNEIGAMVGVVTLPELVARFDADACVLHA